jgi:hypothetical protein
MATLEHGGVLAQEQAVVFGNGQFRFIMQLDGNLVGYEDSVALWASNTDSNGCQPFHLCM